MSDLVFDRSLQTRQSATRLLDHFHPDHTVYEASGWTYLPRALRITGVTADDVLADLGCGRGRMLYVAARFYSFRRVIGVDISPELADHARAALDRVSARLRCTDVEVVCANARDWEVPDDLTLVYLYFPFSGQTLRTVVDNLIASLDRNPRRMRILYAAPKQSELLTQSGRFHLVGISRTVGDYIMSRIEIYQSSAIGGPAPERLRPDVVTRACDWISPWWRRLTAVARTLRSLVSVRRSLEGGGVKAAHSSMRTLAVLREDEACVRFGLWLGEATCLELTLVLQAWYAGHGEPHELWIGVRRPDDDILDAHAWLAGRDDEGNADYHVLMRLPPAPC